MLNKDTIFGALIAAASGLAAALLFVLAARGTFFALLLGYLAPAPLMVAALGFGFATGLVGALVGAAFIAAILHPTIALFYVVGVAGPALALCAIALHAPFGGPGLRDAAPGRAVAGAAALAAVSTMFGVFAVIVSAGGFDEAFNTLVQRATPIVEHMTQGAKLPADLTVEDIARKLVRFAPLMMAGSATIMLAFNLFLSGRVAMVSGRLPRPWPPIADDLVLPPALGAVFAIACGLALIDGPIGVLAGVVAAALGAAFALQGLAVAHVLTRGSPFRPGLLAGMYALAALIPPWPMIFMAAGGLIESAFHLRARARSRHEP